MTAQLLLSPYICHLFFTGQPPILNSIGPTPGQSYLSKSNNSDLLLTSRVLSRLLANSVIGGKCAIRTSVEYFPPYFIPVENHR